MSSLATVQTKSERGCSNCRQGTHTLCFGRKRVPGSGWQPCDCQTCKENAAKKSKPLRNRQRCQALSIHGKKCSDHATHYANYHGDAELYGYGEGKPTWVRVTLCEKHRIEQSSQQSAALEWRCFHCGEVFTEPEAAKEHFGSDQWEGAESPGCVSPLRHDEKARLKAVRDAETHARKMQAEAEDADELRGRIAQFESELRRWFGEECTSLWLAHDRYDNVKFERDQLRQQLADALKRDGVAP